MPTISTDSIEGFAEMTAEQKVEALLKLEVPEKVDMSGFIPKAQFDKTASELADAKKQIKSRMTDEEQAKAAADSAMKELQEKYNDLLKSSTIANHTAKYMAMPGYDEKLARETAEALFAGNMDKVFENQQKANVAYEKQIKADLTRQDPRPGGAGGGGENEVPENIKLAQKLGKARHQSQSASDDILKHYMK